MTLRTFRLIVPMLVACVALTGCGGEAPIPKVPVQPVAGKVFYKGKPAANAIIRLFPVNNTDPNALRPQGLSKEDGTFDLGTYGVGDGIPPGEYVVTIIWGGPKEKRSAPNPNDPDDDGGEGDFFRGRYANPRTSTIKVKVEAGTTEIPPFQL